MQNRKTKQIVGALIASMILVLSASVHSQTVDPTSQPDSLRKWKSELITESRVLYRLDSGRKDQLLEEHFEDHLQYSFEYGYMHNTSSRLSYGLGVEVAYNAEYRELRLALRPRLRHWINRKATLDVSPGLYVHSAKTKIPGYSLSSTLMHNNKIGVTARMDFVKSLKEEEWRTHFYGGVTFGSKPGVAVAIFGPIVAGIVFLAVLASDPP